MEEMRLKQEQRQREAEEKMERMQREEMQQIKEMKVHFSRGMNAIQARAFVSGFS